ncbi:MAG: QueT transporter family protein [Eubacteriales bacterium]
MKNQKTLFVARAALIAALYVAFAVLLPSNGVIQLRVAEALTVLPVFTPAAVPGLFIGCIIGNILSGCVVWDVVFGSLATLIGALGTYFLRSHRFLSLIPPIAANTVIVPFVLAYAYGAEGTIPFFMLTVGIGELLSCGVLGFLLRTVLEKYGKKIRWN